jgi:hypothetical protein
MTINVNDEITLNVRLKVKINVENLKQDESILDNLTYWIKRIVLLEATNTIFIPEVFEILKAEVNIGDMLNG